MVSQSRPDRIAEYSLNEALRVEYFKSRVRRLRYREEIQLVQEERNDYSEAYEDRRQRVYTRR